MATDPLRAVELNSRYEDDLSQIPTLLYSTRFLLYSTKLLKGCEP